MEPWGERWTAPSYPSSGAEQIRGGLARIRDDVGLRCLFDLQEKIIRFCARSVPRHTEWFIWSRSNPQRSEKKKKENIVCCQSCKNNESSGIGDTLSTLACVNLKNLSAGRRRTSQVKSPDQYVSFICMFDCCLHNYWWTVKTFNSIMKLLLWLRCWLINNLSVNVCAEAGDSLVSRITSWQLIYPCWW